MERKFGRCPDPVKDPPWLGDERLHSSHRSALLWKAKNGVDQIAVIGKKLREEGWKETYAKEVRSLGNRSMLANRVSNWYLKYQWKDPVAKNYWWPTKELK